MVSISCILPTARSEYSLLGLPDKHIFEPTFESLRKQIFKDFELIVCDALWPSRKGFTELDWGFPIKYVPAYPNHRYWLDRKRWGVAGMLNTALLQCEGELVVRLDDCCEFEESYLQRFWAGYQNGVWPMAMHIRYLGGKPARFDSEYRKNGYEMNYAIGREKDRAETLRKLYGEEGIIRDTRYQIVKARGGYMKAPPDWFYGYASAPLEALLKVNGYDERFDGDKSLEDADCGSRLQMAGYGGLPVLDVNLQVIENEHGPIREDVIARNVRTMKCNYALYLFNRYWKTWKANSDLLTRTVCEGIRKMHCPACNNYERCKGEELGGRFWIDDSLLEEFLKGQRVFDLREERLNI